MATSLPDFPPFDTESEPTSLDVQWKKWILRLGNLFVALEIKDKVGQKALLLHYGGANLADIYYTLASEDDKEYQQVKEKLQAHFEPKLNFTFETYNFRVQTSSVNLLKDNSNKWEEILRCKEAKCFAYDGKRVCWTDSLEILNAFVKHTIEQTGVWWSPGGRYKKFISNNSDLILSWNYDKGLLSFHGKTGDRLNELFMDICTSKRSPLINTSNSLRIK